MSWDHVIEEVSRQLDVPVQKILTAMHGALPVRSLDEPLREHEAHNLLQLLPSQTQEPPDEEAIRASDRQLLERVLACLDEREQYIIRGYYGLDGNEAQPLERIASRLGVSRERVRQIKEGALTRLRHPSFVHALQALVDEE